MAGKVTIVRNTTIETIVRIVVDSTTGGGTGSGTVNTIFLPASGFLLAGEQTQTLPVSLGVRSIQGVAKQSIDIYRAAGQTTSETNSIFTGTGSFNFNSSTGWIADYEAPTGDFTIVFTSFGTLYLHLSKLSGYTQIFNPEQTGHLAG